MTLVQWFFGILCPLIALFSTASLISKRSFSLKTLTDTLMSTLRLNYLNETPTVLVAIYHLLLLLSGVYLGALIASDVRLQDFENLSQLSGMTVCTTSLLVNASLN